MPKPLRVRYPTINRRVDDLLARNKITRPSVPVEDIAASLGIEIAYRTLEDSLSGFLLRRDGRMVIGINDRHSLERQRFTVGHELGHALLHDGDELHVDHGFRVNLRGPEASKAISIEEIEANVFAATLLMPRRMILRNLEEAEVDIEDEQQVGDLAAAYQVSKVAMSFRLMNLVSRAD